MRYIVLSIGGLIALVALGVMMVSGALIKGSVTYQGTFIDPPEPVDVFYLSDSEHTILSTKDLRGTFVILVFGTTSPTGESAEALRRLAEAVDALGNRARKVQVLFVGVDPERDTPHEVSAHAASFHTSFLGGTGTRDQINDIASRFGIYYEKVFALPDTTGYTISSNMDGLSLADSLALIDVHSEVSDNYEVLHTTSMIVLDDRGHIVLLWPFDTPVDGLVADLINLFRYV